MEPTRARPKTASASKPSVPSSRKRTDAIRDLPPTAVRLSPELRERLDAIVERRNTVLAEQGASTSRAALIVTAVREFCDREEATPKASA